MFPVKKLCEVMHINRSGFYKWKDRMDNPSNKIRSKLADIKLFEDYHNKYPSHGYRWLNAIIRNETGLVVSNQYAHKCCKFAGIKSKASHYKYYKKENPFKIYPNLLSAGINVNRPLQCVVSDMTAFKLKGIYYEITFFMDIWNNEILSYSLSTKKGDRMTYLYGLSNLLELKTKYLDLPMILHTDRGSVYSSKAFNELLPAYCITRSMSRPGTPTDNATMEAINGWIKDELFTDFHVMSNENIESEIAEYINFFNEKRPAYALNYLTPVQYKELYAEKLNLCV